MRITDRSCLDRINGIRQIDKKIENEKKVERIGQIVWGTVVPRINIPDKNNNIDIVV